MLEYIDEIDIDEIDIDEIDIDEIENSFKPVNRLALKIQEKFLRKLPLSFKQKTKNKLTNREKVNKI